MFTYLPTNVYIPTYKCLHTYLQSVPIIQSTYRLYADEVFIEYKITSRKSFSVPTTDNGNTNVGSL